MTTLARRNGANGLSRIAPRTGLLRSPFDHLFDDFFGSGPFGASESATTSVLRLDVRETDEEIRVQAEMPGVDPEQVDVTLANEVLSISGEKVAEADEEEEGSLKYRERSYGKFRRDLQLPYAVDPESMEAVYRHGVLEVRMRKAPEHQPRKIKIDVK